MKAFIKCGKIVLVMYFGLMVMCPLVNASPLISQDPTGTFSSGHSISIQGTGFGINKAVGSSDLQYLGDNIEDGKNSDVFTADGWGVYATTEDNERAVPRYSQVRAHSGSQSIVIDYLKSGSINRYKGHFFRDHGSMIERVYVSFWVRSERMGTTGQWKIWRMKNNTSFVDGSLDFIQNSFHPNLASGTKIAVLHTTRYQSDWDCDGCAYDSAEQYLNGTEVPGPAAVMDRWVRMEYWIDVGTLDNHDGTFFYKFHDPDHPTTPVIKDIAKLSFDKNLMVLKTGTNEDWRAMLFGGGAVDGLDLLTYWDDVFTQVGSWARVEIGNAPTWSACTHREIQTPTSWSENSIAFNFNPGSFSQGDQVYLFVVDDNGIASNGHKITIGSVTSGDLTISTSTLPESESNIAYNYALSASGGEPPYFWSLESGKLPAGLSLNPLGDISGTPTGTGTETFAVKVTDNIDDIDLKTLSVTVNEPPPLSISTSTLSTGVVNSSYEQVIVADGGDPQYTWSLTGGNLPTGLIISPEGVISGVPAEIGSETIAVTVTDSGGSSAEKQFNIVVMDVPSGMTLYWKMDEGKGDNVGDMSGQGNELSLNGVSWSEGKYGSALSFDGSNDYANIDDSLLSIGIPCVSSQDTKDFTIAAWVKLNSSNKRQPIISKQSNLIRGFLFEVTSSNNLSIEVFKDSSSRTDVISSSLLTVGQWYHVAVTYNYVGDGVSTIRLFINGAVDGSSDSVVGPLMKNDVDLELGRYYWDSSYQRYYDGLIDEVQIYSRALSEDEISALMNSGEMGAGLASPVGFKSN